MPRILPDQQRRLHRPIECLRKRRRQSGRPKLRAPRGRSGNGFPCRLIHPGRRKIHSGGEQHAAERKDSCHTGDRMKFHALLRPEHPGCPEEPGEQQSKQIQRPDNKCQIHHPVNQKNRESEKDQLLFRTGFPETKQKQSDPLERQETPSQQSGYSETGGDVQELVVRMKGPPGRVAVKEIFRRLIWNIRLLERFRADPQRMIRNQSKGRFPDHRPDLVLQKRIQSLRSPDGQQRRSPQQNTEQGKQQNLSSPPRQEQKEPDSTGSGKRQQRGPRTGTDDQKRRKQCSKTRQTPAGPAASTLPDDPQTDKRNRKQQKRRIPVPVSRDAGQRFSESPLPGGQQKVNQPEHAQKRRRQTAERIPVQRSEQRNGQKRQIQSETLQRPVPVHKEMSQRGKQQDQQRRHRPPGKTLQQKNQSFPFQQDQSRRKQREIPAGQQRRQIRIVSRQHCRPVQQQPRKKKTTHRLTHRLLLSRNSQRRFIDPCRYPDG